MKLASLFQCDQIVYLLSESDTHVALSLQDPQTSDVWYAVITADIAVLPDEAVLSIEVSEVRDDIDLAGWWEHGDVVTEGDVPAVLTRAEPEPTWMVTPDGQEIDLRAHAGGLF